MRSSSSNKLLLKQSSLFGFLLFLLCTFASAPCTNAEVQQSSLKAQEDFVLAVARAQTQSNLFVAGMAPFDIHAKIMSDWAWHAVREGEFDEQWLDRDHWKQNLKFFDYEEVIFKNDDGSPWLRRSTTFNPIRARQLHQLVSLSLPTLNDAATYLVTESEGVSIEGYEMKCFSVSRPAGKDNPNYPAKFCFEKDTGLLRTIDKPSNFHISFESYIPFQGKLAYSVVHATADGFPVLDIDLTYAPLAFRKIEGLVPLSGMKRQSTSASPANPEEWKLPNLLKDATVLPFGLLTDERKQPVRLRLFVGEDGHVQDATLETAPDEAMAKAALHAAGKLVFTPLLVNDKPSAVNFFFDISFSRSFRHGQVPNSTATQSEVPLTEQTLQSLFAVCHTGSRILKIQEGGLERLHRDLPAWYPSGVWNAEVNAVRDMSLVDLALPIYQKHLLDSTGKKLLRAFATPSGQQLLYRSVLSNAVLPLEVSNSQETLSGEQKKRAEEERLLQEEISSTITATDQQNLFAWTSTEEGRELVGQLPAMQKELEVALLRREIELMGEITKTHSAELLKAWQDSNGVVQRP